MAKHPGKKKTSKKKTKKGRRTKRVTTAASGRKKRASTAGLALLLGWSLGCAGALWVTKEPVPETAQVVQQADGTSAMLVAEKTTCFLIWTIAEGSTPCGSSAQWAAEAFQFIGGALDFGKRFLPSGMFPKPEAEESAQ